MSETSNAQVALMSAVDMYSGERVTPMRITETATKFLEWLEKNS